MKTQHGSNWKGGRRLNNGYWMIYAPEHPRSSHGYAFEHVLIAERIVGHSLAPAVQIHHWGDKSDNKKLVICEDQDYHQLLHKRTDAIRAVGDSNKRRCVFCRRWDTESNLYIRGGRYRNGTAWHRKCATDYHRDRVKLGIFRGGKVRSHTGRPKSTNRKEVRK